MSGSRDKNALRCLLGSDVIRGVLELGAGLPLGKRGLFWLKVHLANLNGTTSKWVWMVVLR